MVYTSNFIDRTIIGTLGQAIKVDLNIADWQLGVLGGMAPEPETLTLLKRTADRMFGDSYQFSVLAAGRAQIAMATMSAAMGGHVRVGLEDNLYIAKGQLAESNAQQVTLIREIVERLGRQVATPNEAREILHLKGRDKVAF
jgi:uncharacterized protein (DUF849 family)